MKKNSSLKKLVVLTGAGISAESGIKTFRDANGLWENHDIMEVASPAGFRKNPQLVLEFYNQRRAQLKNCEPNLAHKLLVELEQFFDLQIITQNVDNLHQKAGSKNILHLHGELMKVRSTNNENKTIYWDKNLNVGDLAEDGSQLRPHIVWFGEDVPKMEEAISITKNADLLLIIGTSLQVYPAASLIDYAPNKCPIYLIDPNVEFNNTHNSKITHIKEKATIGMEVFLKEIKANY